MQFDGGPKCVAVPRPQQRAICVFLCLATLCLYVGGVLPTCRELSWKGARFFEILQPNDKRVDLGGDLASELASRASAGRWGTGASERTGKSSA